MCAGPCYLSPEVFSRQGCACGRKVSSRCSYFVWSHVSGNARVTSPSNGDGALRVILPTATNDVIIILTLCCGGYAQPLLIENKNWRRTCLLGCTGRRNFSAAPATVSASPPSPFHQLLLLPWLMRWRFVQSNFRALALLARHLSNAFAL